MCVTTQKSYYYLKGNPAPGLPYDFLFESDGQKKDVYLQKKSR